MHCVRLALKRVLWWALHSAHSLYSFWHSLAVADERVLSRVRYVYISSMMLACLLTGQLVVQHAVDLVDLQLHLHLSRLEHSSHGSLVSSVRHGTSRVPSRWVCSLRSCQLILPPAVGCALHVLVIDPTCGWQYFFRFFSVPRQFP